VSTTLISDRSGLTVTQYVGPELPLTGERRRYQITNDAGLLTTLSRPQWEALGEWFTRDCSPECEGPHLQFTWDKEP
jgi:hypothetical protein